MIYAKDHIGLAGALAGFGIQLSAGHTAADVGDVPTVELGADVTDGGSIQVENHTIGRVRDYLFPPETQSVGTQSKVSRNAVEQVLSKELAMRARRVASAKAEAFKLTRSFKIFWRDEEIARLEAGEDPLKPRVILLVDENLQGPDKDKVQERLNAWMAETIALRLTPLVELSKADDVAGLARGIAFMLTENLGVLKRESVSEEIKSLEQTGRAQLRKYGVRFGAFNIYFPLLLKPEAGELRLILWFLKSANAHGISLEQLPEPPRPGLPSMLVDKALPETFYRACGYHVCGPRAVRMDILERLADLIRPLIAWRAPVDNPSAQPPYGSTGDGAFRMIPEMISILGGSPEESGEVMKNLGFWKETRATKESALAPDAATEAAKTAKDKPAPTEGTTFEALVKNTFDDYASAQPEMEEVWRPLRRPLRNNERPEPARVEKYDQHRGIWARENRGSRGERSQVKRNKLEERRGPMTVISTAPAKKPGAIDP